MSEIVQQELDALRDDCENFDYQRETAQALGGAFMKELGELSIGIANTLSEFHVPPTTFYVKEKSQPVRVEQGWVVSVPGALWLGSTTDIGYELFKSFAITPDGMFAAMETLNRDIRKADLGERRMPDSVDAYKYHEVTIKDFCDPAKSLAEDYGQIESWRDYTVQKISYTLKSIYGLGQKIPTSSNGSE